MSEESNSGLLGMKRERYRYADFFGWYRVEIAPRTKRHKYLYLIKKNSLQALGFEPMTQRLLLVRQTSIGYFCFGNPTEDAHLLIDDYLCDHLSSFCDCPRV